MAIYKVLQDIEAEDKFVGPLTLKQFIFMAIAFISGYLSFFFATRHVYFLLGPLLPTMLLFGFLGFPFHRDQPTEIWLLAKIRFWFKPRVRIWDQSGEADLVTITAPKKVEHYLTNNLTQIEVKSRLKALAETIDSRGWAAKDANVNLYAPTVVTYAVPDSDRLVGASTLPQVKNQITANVGLTDDMLDEKHNPKAKHLGQMLQESAIKHRETTIKHMETIRTTKPKPVAPVKAKVEKPKEPKPDYWFMNKPDDTQLRPGYAMFGAQTVRPGAENKSLAKVQATDEDEELLHKKHTKKERASLAYGNTKVILPLDEQEPVAPPLPPKPIPSIQDLVPPIPSLTTPVDPAIINLANNDDLSVATIAREANKQTKSKDGEEPLQDEVVISLH